jgi:8-amino-7-oxononanoate synthase
MAEDGHGERLGRDDKMKVIAGVMKVIAGMGRGPRHPSIPSPWPAAAGSARAVRRADFSTLESYQHILSHRAGAELLGLGDPYFRVHAGRAGTMTEIDGAPLLNFASYDYLGLNQHPEVAAAAKVAIDRYGTSVSASRLVAGERPLHLELERALADFLGVDGALAFVSGHATNVATIGELLGPKDLVVYDALSHNSILLGAQLSGAARRSFPHNDFDALDRILAESRRGAARCLIVVESLYSMDGDLPDLRRLLEIKTRHDAWLMVDEAHGLGVLGATGRGLAEHHGIDPRDVDIWMGTLSKTFAAAGGFVAGSHSLIDLLKFTCSAFVYSVGLAPPVAAAALAALRILEREPERVARLARNGRLFVETARAHGLDAGTSAGFAVVPILVGDSPRAVKLCERLLARGINVLPIIYPAVPMQSARLRFFIGAEHEEAHIRSAVEATAQELERLVAEGFGVGRIAALALAAGRTSS